MRASPVGILGGGSTASRMDMYNMTEEELRDQVVELSSENKRLSGENELFESFLKRFAAAGHSEPTEEASDEEDELTRQVRTLSVAQRIGVVTSEVDAIKVTVDIEEKRHQKEIDRCHAQKEEHECTISDLRRDLYEFKRDIVVVAENFRDGKVKPDKLIKYAQERVLGIEAQAENLKAKAKGLMAGIVKLEGQVRQKQEMGETLAPIDFDQLRIENHQYLQKIDEKNNEMLRLKMISTRTTTDLNERKAKLGADMVRGEFLKKRLARKGAMLKRTKEDIVAVRAELKASKKLVMRLQQEMEDTDLPKVIDYIQVKSKADAAEKKIEDWKRKVEIAAFARKQLKAKINAARGL